MTFKPGQSGNPHGRKPGTTNKITKTVRQAFEDAFAHLQENPSDKWALRTWAKDNPTPFYSLASKLIPLQVAAVVEDTTTLTETQRAARLAALAERLEKRHAGEEEDSQQGEPVDDLA